MHRYPNCRKKYGSPNPKGLMEYISTCKREFKPQTKFQYSCLNYITLQHIIEIHYRAKLARLCKRKYLRYTGNAIHGLSAHHTTAGRKVDQYGALSLDGPDCTYRKTKDGSVLCGQVHDPLARILNGGISGNAGIFLMQMTLASPQPSSQRRRIQWSPHPSVRWE